MKTDLEAVQKDHPNYSIDKLKELKVQFDKVDTSVPPFFFL